MLAERAAPEPHWKGLTQGLLLRSLFELSGKEGHRLLRRQRFYYREAITIMVVWLLEVFLFVVWCVYVSKITWKTWRAF